ncbi:hypothetical protein BC01_037 [Bacillus phage BC01]|nr:hypothetical protein BC01_037 [Bacillus phage BC01]
MGKTFLVEIPVVMKLAVYVEDVNTREEAIEAVRKADVTIEPVIDGDKFEVGDYEWDLHKQVVQGNVYYGCINEQSAELVEDEEDEEEEE